MGARGSEGSSMTGFTERLGRAALALLCALAAAPAPAQPPASDSPRLRLEPCRLPGIDEELRCGTYNVFENRETRRGRMLPLRVVLIPAREPAAGRAPVFVIGGGPGQTATDMARNLVEDWQRVHHDVLLVDQRGTGEGHRLDCRVAGSDEDVQGYLEPIFDVAAFRACRARLARDADLARYTTSDAADDLDEIRQALGYERINLVGGSYGTRAIMTYVRRHGPHVRAAVLSSPAPFSFRNPLYHARSAQEAWEALVAECRAEPACHAAFPNLQADFESVRARLRAAPARVRVRHPATEASVEVTLSEEAFGEAVRVIMYRADSARTLPLAISRAAAGDLGLFASTGLIANRRIRSILRFGMLLSVVCSEDMPRIDPAEIETATLGTYLGDNRVREQMAVCAEWPRATIPADYAAPLTSSVPVLILSGNLDPVTTPEWGDETARMFPRGLHLVLPDGHAPNNPCTDALATAFMLRGSIEGLDTGCVAATRPPPFALPEAVASRRTEASRAR